MNSDNEESLAECVKSLRSDIIIHLISAWAENTATEYRNVEKSDTKVDSSRIKHIPTQNFERWLEGRCRGYEKLKNMVKRKTFSRTECDALTDMVSDDLLLEEIEECEKRCWKESRFSNVVRSVRRKHGVVNFDIKFEEVRGDWVLDPETRQKFNWKTAKQFITDDLDETDGEWFATLLENSWILILEIVLKIVFLIQDRYIHHTYDCDTNTDTSEHNGPETKKMKMNQKFRASCRGICLRCGLRVTTLGF